MDYTTTQTSGTESEVTDLSFIRSFKGNEQSVLSSLNIFIKQTPRFLMQLSKGIKINNRETVVYAASKLKTSFEKMSIEKGANLSFQIKAEAQRDTPKEELDDLARQLSDCFQRAKEELTEALGRQLSY